MSVIDKIKDSNLAKDARNTMIGIATAVASMAPVHSQAQNTERQDPATDKIEVVAQTNDAPVNTASTINFMDVVNEQRTAEAQVWEGGDNAASQADTVQAPVEEQMEAVDRMEEREVISNILDNYSPEIVANTVVQGTTKNDTTDVSAARAGIQRWQEEDDPGIEDLDIYEAQQLANGQIFEGYFSRGEENIHILETYDEEDANYMASNISDEEDRNCAIDFLTDENRRGNTTAHEGQHRNSTAQGIYQPTSETTWLGCEAYAKINAADELGARIAELGRIRDLYIQAGGGEAGLQAIREAASTNTHNSMLSEYAHMIETGQVNPMSNNPDDQKRDFAAIGKIANNQWSIEKYIYDQQLCAAGLRGAVDNHLCNVEKDDDETRARCDQALTVNMIINGERVPVNFGEYVPEIKLPSNVQQFTRAMDDNPDLVAEYAQNGSQAFRDKTDRMQRTVDASKGHVATNNNKSQDKVQTNTQTNTQTAMQTNTQTNKQDREAMIQQALRKSRGR